MQPPIRLPGFDRLRATLLKLQSEGLPTRWASTHAISPFTDSHLAGLPMDPLLAAMYSQVGEFGFREGLFLLPRESAHGLDVFSVNKAWRSDWPTPFRELLVFGKEDRLASYYATAPQLVDERGAQPVLFVDVHEEPHGLPVGSTVDRFFDTYSRYLEMLVQSPGFEEEGSGALAFPWGVPELIARDSLLLEMLRAGHFDKWMRNSGSTPEWVERVLTHQCP